jgi:L-alanine-DL-glutamate epimerase-like enolase superfamily enzyme
MAMTPILGAQDIANGLRITRIVAFDLPSKRNKLAGKNARLDVHGDSAVDPMVRIYTSAGVDGIGVCRASKESLAKLLGHGPTESFDADKLQITGPLGSQTMPLWDLLGKLQKKPVCELLGAKPTSEPRRVPVYDGSIYFADLLPAHEQDWEDEFKREIDQGLKLGHRGFKIKIGRGAKWMPRKEGDDRDIAVVKLIRAHAGKDVLLAVDANNGYDLEGAKRFVERADADLAFTEEMFPENIEQDRALKQFYAEHYWPTLIADGETQSDYNAFKPFIETQTLDILQGDINHFGVEGIRAEAALARPQGVHVAPHNWGSLIGFYHALQVGASIDNFYRAEHDPLSTDLLIADGYVIKDGYATLPNAPGFGLALSESRFADAKVRFDLKV